jgi:hypothetical protein
VGSAPALTERTLGAWLLKADPRLAPVTQWLEDDFADVGRRCVRPTYRTALVRPGQPVLLWISGADPRTPSGVHAYGVTTGVVREDPDDGWVLPLSLSRVDPPVLRADLLADPVLRVLEVLRMPAGSNPSYLSVEQYAALRPRLPSGCGGPEHRT